MEDSDILYGDEANQMKTELENQEDNFEKIPRNTEESFEANFQGDEEIPKLIEEEEEHRTGKKA